MTDTSSMGEIPDDWIEHDGKGMPVDGETQVLVRFRDGIQEELGQEARAVWWSPIAGSHDHWTTEGSYRDIVAYRVVSP